MERGSGDRVRNDGNAGADAADRAPDGLRRFVPAAIRRRYAVKFVFALLVVILLVAGLGGLSYVQIQGIIEEDARNTLRSTATMQADSVGEWVAGGKRQANALSAAGVFASGDDDAIRAYLNESLALADDDVLALHYVNTTRGTVAVSTNQVHEGKDVVSVGPSWQDAIEAATSHDHGDAHVAEGAFERNGQIRMAFVSRVRGSDGVLVLVGDVGSDFEQLHETRPIVQTHVLDRKGYDVFAPRQNIPSQLSEEPAFDEALNGETSTVERDDVVLAYAPVPNSGWVVVTEAPTARLYEASHTVGRNVAVLVAASLLTLGAVGLLFGRGTVVPLIRLRRRAQAMEEGDLDVELTTTREDEIGRLFHSFASMRDALREQIDEANAARRDAERTSRQLARQNERLDQFASTVSHDLRNPLSVADGYAEMVAEGIDDLPDDLGGPQLRTYVAKVRAAHGRMEDLVEEVLLLARGGEDDLDPETLDLEATARDAWDNVDTKQADLEIAGSREVEADRAQLLRAFENVFRNSVEHGSTSSRAEPDDAVEHAGPTVTLEVGPTSSGFYVMDDGPGIPADAADEIFEFGYTDSESGTGLGLAIVRTVAESHGWTVELDPEADGARFVFTTDDPA